jgi:hypothetical protein
VNGPLLKNILEIISIITGSFGFINGRSVHLVPTDRDWVSHQVIASVVFSVIGISIGWGYPRTNPPKTRIFWSAVAFFVLAVLSWLGYSVLHRLWGVSPPQSPFGRAAFGPVLVLSYAVIFGLLSLGFSLIGFGL